MMIENADEIRKALIALFPNENIDEFSIEHSGFVVLISSIVLGTTDNTRIYGPMYFSDVELEQMVIRKIFAKAITDQDLKVVLAGPPKE